ncbi:MAG: (deoxy)nucleoside triphosphate pyrophosphohydrolase [Candidatus Omnitrophica bacterium]|nr:(deoxy)nucleoside triphosphate pyrophosphohydrolase [Candidatus Omnitrophota bacterium]MBU4477519.1 (deoxy)nucleoside triphosphate pyrophosphohydrolase [Candidatus Omnitrophota bacterium]
MEKRFVKVVAALVENKGCFLVAQRLAGDAYGLLWEFPGGKVETGETPEQALQREMREELGVEVEVGAKVAGYDDESEDLRIHVDLYQCDIFAGVPLPVECNDVRWVSLEQMQALPLAPADKKVFCFLREKYASSRRKNLTSKHISGNILP